MGTLEALTPLLGLLAGIIVAALAPSELKDGKPYFILLQHLTLASILVALLWEAPVFAFLAGAALFFTLWKKHFPHPLTLMPALAAPAAMNSTALIPLFLYFIPTGTLHKTKELILLTGTYAALAILLTL